MARLRITISKDGIIQYNSNSIRKIERMLYSTTSKTKAIDHAKQAQAYTEESNLNFWHYIDKAESAILSARAELYSAFNGKIPLSALQQAADNLLGNPQHKIDVVRDELVEVVPSIRTAARRWEREGYTWKEAAIEELQKKFSELDGMGRQADKSTHIR